MTEHTPSTTDIRIRYERYREQEHQRCADGVTPVTPGEFERWLAVELAAAEQRGAAKALNDYATALEAVPDYAPSEYDQGRVEQRHMTITELLERVDRIERTTDDH